MDLNITLVIQFAAFLAVAWMVMKFGWPHIMAAIEERQQKIAEGLAAADRSQQDLARAEEKVAEALKEARTKANEIIDQAKEDAIAEANRQKAAAESEIAASTNRAREELRKQVSVLAVSGAEKLLKREIDAGAHKALIDELAAQL